MAFPGLAIHIPAGLCALWLTSGARRKTTPFTRTTAPFKPPAQSGGSTWCRLQHICCALQWLHLTLQWPMACSGQAIHALAGLCALWLASGASTDAKVQHSAKPQPPQSTCPARPQHTVQAPPQLLHTAEAAFDLEVALCMPRAGHSHTGRALCAVVVECCLLLWNSPQQTGKTASPTNHLPPTPAAVPSAGSTTPAAHCRGCM